MPPAKKKNEDDPSKWRTCEAKRIVYCDLLAGLIPETMKAREVYDSYKDEPAFSKVPWKNFSERLKRLRNKVIDKNDHIQGSDMAIAIDVIGGVRILVWRAGLGNLQNEVVGNLVAVCSIS